MTRRESIIDHLKTNPSTITELAIMFETVSGVIVEDLEHIFKTLKNSPGQLLIKPAECLNSKCNFVFPAHRKRFSDPKKCPECHSERIANQVFKIE
jgi:predicted Zn-ribbon and HTH transcriptional regulator